MKKLVQFLLILGFINSFIQAQDVTILEPVSGASVEWINVSNQWNETSVDVVQGNSYTIVVNGVCSTQGGTYPQHGYYVGPEGLGGINPSFPVPDAIQQSVIGKIGSDGTGFMVGRRCSFMANKSGKLFLGINDNQPGDNIGFYVAYVFASNLFITEVNENNSYQSEQLDFTIEQNYPNPFNPTTTIQYEIKKEGIVDLKIYDVTGSLIKNIVNDYVQPGQYKVTWDSTNESGQKVASGTYIYQIKIDNNIIAKKMLLLK
ncbi:MAG: T9SS type A sorting domain-containing protein [bacterium]